MFNSKGMIFFFFPPQLLPEDVPEVFILFQKLACQLPMIFRTGSFCEVNTGQKNSSNESTNKEGLGPILVP